MPRHKYDQSSALTAARSAIEESTMSFIVAEEAESIKLLSVPELVDDVHAHGEEKQQNN